jgi:hypothetical protein
MSDQIANRVLDMLQALAAKLGTTVEHVYGVTVKQALINATTDMWIGGAILMLGLSLWAMALLSRSDDTRAGSFAVGCVVLFFGTCFLIGGVKGRLNPEYYALKDLMAMMGHLK